MNSVYAVRDLIFALAVLCLSLIGLASAVSACAEDEIVIAFDNYPPYHYWVDGEPAGLNVDITKCLCKRIGETPQFVRLPWSRSLHSLKTGAVMGMLAAFKTEERQQFSYYPELPLTEEVAVVAVRADSEISISSLDDLKDYTVGVVKNYSYGEDFDSCTKLTKVVAPNDERLVSLLLNNRVDIALGNDQVFNDIVTRRFQEGRIKYIHTLTQEPLYILLSKAHGERARQLSKKIGDALLQMYKSGDLNDLNSCK